MLFIKKNKKNKKKTAWNQEYQLCLFMYHVAKQYAGGSWCSGLLWAHADLGMFREIGAPSDYRLWLSWRVKKWAATLVWGNTLAIHGWRWSKVNDQWQSSIQDSAPAAPTVNRLWGGDRARADLVVQVLCKKSCHWWWFQHHERYRYFVCTWQIWHIILVWEWQIISSTEPRYQCHRDFILITYKTATHLVLAWTKYHRKQSSDWIHARQPLATAQMHPLVPWTWIMRILLPSVPLMFPKHVDNSRALGPRRPQVPTVSPHSVAN